MSTCMHVTMTATTIAASTATSKLSNNKTPHSTAMFNPPPQPPPPPPPQQTTTEPAANLIGPDIATNTPIISSNHGPPHYVDLHVNAGECISLQLLDGQEQVLTGPATITMISQQQNPPVPIPVQVPPGHMVHQIADENGTLKHIILSVMVNEENSHLHSAVISLPHGNFRINSLGELVNVGSDIASDRESPNQLQDQSSIAQATSSTNSSTAPTIHHLAQQQPTSTYFANYDNCPIANYDTTLAGYAAHHYSNQSAYNGIMTSSYHHESTSPSSYKTSPSLLSHPTPIMPVAPATGSYPFAYSNFNQVQSHQATTMTNVLSPGKQSNSHRKNTTSSSVHQTAAAYKVNDNNENNLPRSKRGDQVVAQNNLNGNVASSNPNLSTRHQHNEISSKRQPQHLVGLDESNMYNSNPRIPVANQASNSGSGQHHNHHNHGHHHHNHHHHNRNFRSSAGGNNGPIVNSRVGRLRGTYNNHHHQNHSATLYNLRNNYNSFNGNATQEAPSIESTDVLCSNQAAKEVKPVIPTQNPNLSSPTSKQQQRQPSSQRSTNNSKNRSSSPPTEETPSVGDNASSVKRSEDKTSNTTKEINVKQKPEIELEISEIVKCPEHLNNFESPIPPRNSRGKQKKCHEDSAKHSNEQPNHKLQQSIDDPGKVSADSLRSRSVNEDNNKITANGISDNKVKMKSQRKNSTQQENIKQTQFNKITNTSEISSTVTSDKVLKNLHIDKDIGVDVQPVYAVETKEAVVTNANVDSGSPMVGPKRFKARDSITTVIDKVDSSNPPKAKPKQIETSPRTPANPVSNLPLKSESPSRKKTGSHNHHHHHHPVKFSTLVKQCRNKFVTSIGTLVQNSLSSCSDTKFAGLLLVLFTVVAMLLAIIIHLYIV